MNEGQDQEQGKREEEQKVEISFALFFSSFTLAPHCVRCSAGVLDPSSLILITMEVFQ